MTPAATAFASRTVIPFMELLTIARDHLEAASDAIEAGELDQAVDGLRAAAGLAVQAGGGATRLASAIDAERGSK